MRCTDCNSNVPDDAKICPFCGEDLSLETMAHSQHLQSLNANVPEYICPPEAAEKLANAEKTEQIDPKKIKKRKMSILISAAALTILLGVGFYFIDTVKACNESVFSKVFASRLNKIETLVAVQTVGTSPRASEIELTSSHTNIQKKPKIEGVSESYYQQGLLLLDEATDEGNRVRAGNIGSISFQEKMDIVLAHIDGLRKSATNQTEKDFSQAVFLVGLYALSNDYEYAVVEESGGRNNVEADKKLKDRDEKASQLKELLLDAKSANDISEILKFFDERK